MLLAKSGHIINRIFIFVRQLRDGNIRHDNIPENLFLFLEDHPLLGGKPERIVKFLLKGGRRHIKFAGQLLGGIHTVIVAQDPVFEITVCAEDGSEETSQLLIRRKGRTAR